MQLSSFGKAAQLHAKLKSAYPQTYNFFSPRQLAWRSWQRCHRTSLYGVFLVSCVSVSLGCGLKVGARVLLLSRPLYDQVVRP